MTVTPPLNYNPDLSDRSKNSIIAMDTGTLLKDYIRLCIAHPFDTLEAELLRTNNAWNPYSYIDCYNNDPSIATYADRETSFFAATVASPGHPDSLFPWLQNAIENISSNLVLQHIPIISLLVSIPFYVWILILALFRSIVCKAASNMAMMGFLAILTLSALLGPCVLPRYYLFLVFGFPLLVFAVMKNPKRTSE